MILPNRPAPPAPPVEQVPSAEPNGLPPYPTIPPNVWEPVSRNRHFRETVKLPPRPNVHPPIPAASIGYPYQSTPPLVPYTQLEPVVTATSPSMAQDPTCEEFWHQRETDQAYTKSVEPSQPEVSHARGEPPPRPVGRPGDRKYKIRGVRQVQQKITSNNWTRQLKN
ncbi:unnamed protein product [Protopolystoma xenopodis]|uniref:Uncharacterized protein n=1 Tax=Protopolystoma xenopodis TaxID=117903 RepID=A0A3S5AHX6_9PLAT|nr:unnamed protein product [Protopolystoma xenopodis]